MNSFEEILLAIQRLQVTADVNSFWVRYYKPKAFQEIHVTVFRKNEQTNFRFHTHQSLERNKATYEQLVDFLNAE